MNRTFYKSLRENYSKTKDRRIVDLFRDPKRFHNFSLEGCGLFLDFSKTNIDIEAKNFLFELIKRSPLDKKRADLSSGNELNISESRSVLHVALRSSFEKLTVKNYNVMPEIKQTLSKMKDFSSSIRLGKIRSSSGKKFTDILNIGIGGSSLGPKMAIKALVPYHDGPSCHFVSNVDSADVADTLENLNPETTLIIVASKTFRTLETLTNAKTAISWLKSGVCGSFEEHLAAVSSAPHEALKYGIKEDRVFSFPDGVGGRYSIWGPIGLPLMMAVGDERFLSFLAGAERMDEHFFREEFRQNLPVLLGLVGIWHRNICKYSSRAILPYEHRLAELPSYLQQLDMESNGKHRASDGEALIFETAPVVWGASGTDGQHAFYQMLHQGTSVIPCEFLVGARGHEPNLKHQHDLLIANCLAQSEALMKGEVSESKSLKGLAKECVGNRPSVTILYEQLTPKVLGSLIALFEHRTFVEGVIWEVNSFDQWGVELGKKMSDQLLPFVRKNTDLEDLNPSTSGLLKRLNEY